MSEQQTVEQGEVVVQQYGIFIGFEFAEGGALMYAQSPRGKRSAIVAGDPSSATFQRKVQRTAVKWTKDFFVAPQRAPNKEKGEAEATPE